MPELTRVALCPERLVFNLSADDARKALRKKKILMKLKHGQLHIYKGATTDLFPEAYKTPGHNVYIIGKDFKESRNTLNEIKDLLSYVSDDKQFTYIYEYIEYEKTVNAICNGYSVKVITSKPYYGRMVSVTEEEFYCTACSLPFCPFRD